LIVEVNTFHITESEAQCAAAICPQLLGGVSIPYGGLAITAYKGNSAAMKACMK
jgi:hypothetical protein